MAILYVASQIALELLFVEASKPFLVERGSDPTGTLAGDGDWRPCKAVAAVAQKAKTPTAFEPKPSPCEFVPFQPQFCTSLPGLGHLYRGLKHEGGAVEIRVIEFSDSDFSLESCRKFPFSRTSVHF